MFKKRLIPILLLDDTKLIKTEKYHKPNYVGDPINVVSIFNEKRVDEIFIIDIYKSTKGLNPNFKIIENIASECFMPMCYGGGINNLETAKKIFDLGVEKILLKTSTFHTPNIINDIADIYGNQSVIIAIDLKKNFLGNYFLYSNNSKLKIKTDYKKYINECITRGAGELVINSVDREGTFSGLDLEIIRNIKKISNIPVIINGGLNSLQNFQEGIKAGADAVAAGSFFIYYGKQKAVLITYPNDNELLINAKK